MKLNLWQWIGVVLLVVGVALWLYEKNKGGQQPATQPATQPAGR